MMTAYRRQPISKIYGYALVHIVGRMRLFLCICMCLLIYPLFCQANGDKQLASNYFGFINAVCKSESSCKIFKENLNKLTDCQQVDYPCKAGEDILTQLFGDTYRPSYLPDYIVYFKQPQEGVFDIQRPVLMWENGNHSHLIGVRDIYVLVITEHKACLDAHVTVDYKDEPNPFKTIFSALGTSVDTAAPRETKRKEGQFTWFALSGDRAQGKARLWLAYTRFGIGENSMDRITVRYVNPADFPQNDNTPSECKSPEGGDDEKSKIDLKGEGSLTATKEAKANNNVIKYKLQGEGSLTAAKESNDNKTVITYKGNTLAANGFFSNSSASRVTVSLALGMTFNTKDTSLTTAQDRQSFNGYVFVKYYIKRPVLRAGRINSTFSKRSPSLGIALGTNLIGDHFKELVYGISVGHIFDNVGFILGANSIVGRESTDEGRKTRGFFGGEYSF